MPPKGKKAPKDNGIAVNGKSDKSAPPTTAPSATTPAPTVQGDTEIKPAVGSGRPDQASYQAEQDRLKAEIDALQAKLSAVKEKISLSSKNGPGNERRAALRAELDALRGQQSSSKTSRSKLLEQLKSIQEGIQKKVKDLQAAKAKAPYKTIAEVDNQIKHLEKQVESGNMKLGDEKRALQEISSLKRSRRTVESFQADQEAIEADRARTEALRKQLDDPEAKATSERYDAIRNELDELKKSSDEAFAGRTKLFDERNALSAELDGLFARKRESAQKHREATDRHWQKINEERARRAERLKAQRAAEEEEKRREVVERLLEEAKVPAFQAKIEDCQTLIDYFTAKVAGGSTPVPPPTSLSTSKPGLAGVPKLELRQVDQDGTGLTPRKKKREAEENYFVGGKSKDKKNAKTEGTPAANSLASSSSLNIPFPTLNALLELSIPPPGSSSELPRAIEDLKTKKAWFEANQERVTAENIAKAELQVQRLTRGGGSKGAAMGDVPASVTPPNGTADKSSEPTPTSPNGDEAVEDAVAEDSKGETKSDEGAVTIKATVEVKAAPAEA